MFLFGDNAAGQTKPLDIVIFKEIAFNNPHRCRGVYELDVIAAFYGCDNTDVGDLPFLLSSGKKQQVAGVQFFNLNLFSHFGLGGRLTGQGNVYSTVGIRGKAGAIESRTGVASPLVWGKRTKRVR